MTQVLGIDSSTQSTKVELRDADSGEVVASARASHPETTPPKSEQDPESWWSALSAALDQLTLDDVAAVSVAGQQHGMVLLDSDQQVIRPAKLWNDTESAPEAAELVPAIGAQAWAEACGSVPVASLTISKLAWLKAHEPDSYRRIAHVLLPHDWLTMKLTGEITTDRGDASGTGYWSPFENDWAPRLLGLVDDSVDWLGRLPRVLGPLEAAGENRTAPIPAGTVVAPGTGDNMAAALGFGLSRGDAVISLGTSGTVYAVSDSPVADPSGAVAGFADATGRYLPLVCTLNATKVTDAFARILGVETEWLSRLALAAPPGADGLVLVPYFDGERTPNLPDATGTLAGLRSDTTPEQIARAAFEGVACGLLDGLDALESAGVPVDGRLLLAGGGAKSSAYRRVFAELSGRPIHVSRHDEHVALGAALQAAAVLAGTSTDEVASAWGLGETEIIDAEPVDRQAIRADYRSEATS